jgi:carbamoyltransferase
MFDDVEGEVAELLAAGQVVARFKGRMEFGARALGNRSILANASQPNVVRYINDIIKSRDFWMPFAPSVLADCSADYFHKPKSAKACYMVMSFDTKSNKRNSIFAAVHPQDGTARPQEVYPDDNPEYESLLRKYQSISGDGAILNTSFNLHGYPVVYSPDDALKVFDVSGLEYLALGNFIVSK